MIPPIHPVRNHNHPGITLLPRGITFPPLPPSTLGAIFRLYHQISVVAGGFFPRKVFSRSASKLNRKCPNTIVLVFLRCSHTVMWCGKKQRRSRRSHSDNWMPMGTHQNTYPQDLWWELFRLPLRVLLYLLSSPQVIPYSRGGYWEYVQVWVEN